ncbi:RING-H2 finger protein ATL66-like [Asparagus officinalis]|uniref:RING-H2 finger protein ATL66-like n=1 Tax=Asparagus officinalis TaxID=4686 RepID=UPI00098E14C7|nr:RING-H2 finger protein ATL66-like [Asparagus officinalis]
MNKNASNTGISVTTTLQITIAIVFLNFLLFIIILLFYIRAKGYLRNSRPSRSSRLIFAPHEPALPRHALDPSILRSLHITVFRSEDYKEEGGLECAVCLCELNDGENARFLPKCKHGFHVECIDMWFDSNGTCPLCWEIVSIELEATSEIGNSSDIPSTSQNHEESSRGKTKKGMLIIDIPRQMINGLSSMNSPLPSSRMSIEGMRSPAMRRMLSWGRGKGVGTSCSPRECNVEQGLAASKCQ